MDSQRLQALWRSKYKGNEHLFIESQGKIYPIISGGQVDTTFVRISPGTANLSARSITWPVYFNNPGIGFAVDDITASPQPTTVSIGGSGNRRTVTITYPSTTDLRQAGHFVLAQQPFSDRVLTSNLATRTSNSVAFYPRTSVTFSNAAIDIATRSISWTVIFSNAGSGFTISDITQRPSNAARTISGIGNTRIITLKIAGTNAVQGIANFVIAATAFTDRTLDGATIERTAPNAGYSFPTTIEPPLTSRTISEVSSIPRPLQKGWQVILGNLDISRDVHDISDISRSLDDTNVYGFKVSEVTLSIKNEGGEFSQINFQNRFVLAGVPSSGINSNIKIVSGNRIIFDGKIIEISHNEDTGRMRWVATTPPLDIREDDITNFGEEEKRIRIPPYNREESSQTGIYPFPTAVAPPSEDSVSGVGSAFLQNLNFKKALSTSGVTTDREVEIVGSELHSEAGYFVEGDDPLITFKPPKRYNTVVNLVHDLLEHYGFGKNRVSLAKEQFDEPKFQSMGRIGYATEATEKSGLTLLNDDDWQWKGYPTDFVLDRNGVGYTSSYQGLAEFQGSLYGVDSTSLYRIYLENRTTKNLGNIQHAINPGGISNSGRIQGLASVQDRLFVLTRRDMYEIHIGDDDEINVTRMILSGDDTTSTTQGLRFSNNQGWLVGATSRGDELFIGKRQGIKRAVIKGVHAEIFDVFSYRDILPSEIRPNANNIEYLDGKFYFVSFWNREQAFTSFEMPTGYTAPSTHERIAVTDLEDLYLGTYKGNLIGAKHGSNKYLAYINPMNGEILEELTNPTFYILYSARQSQTTPKLLRYQPLSDTYDVLYDHPTHAEFWQIQTDDFASFNILGGEAEWGRGGPFRAAYNSADHRPGATPNTNQIWNLDTSTTPPTLSVLVDAEDVYRPQLAQYYHLGYDQDRKEFLPDSRKSIQTDLDNLYYIYATRDECGVARREADGTTSSVISAPVDNYHNECGVEFTIGGPNLYATYTFIGETESTLKVVGRSLGRSPRFVRFTATSLTEGTAYDKTIQAVGDPIPVITSAVTTGTLPTGLTLDGARLHGTPSGIPDDGTNFSVTYTAVNTRETVTTVIDYRVSDMSASQPVLGAFTATSMTENTAYDQTITATGSPTPVITSSVTAGTLPTGLTLAGARLHGTPTGIPNAGATFTVTWVATNPEGFVNRDVVFTVTGDPTPDFGSFTSTSLTEGVAYDETIPVDGNPTPTVTSSVTSGTLPTGMTLTAGRLHGTPSNIPDAGSRFTVRFTARSTAGTDTATVRFTVAGATSAPVFGSFTQTALYEDTAYDQTITATGNPSPTITSAVTSGFLPDNMTLSGARLYSTGNPQIITDAGTTFTVTFTAASTAGTRTLAVNFTIGTNRLPVFDDFSHLILTEGTAYNQTVTATGVPSPTITSSYISGPTGGLSAHGLTLSGATLSGTPTSVPDSGFFFNIDFTATSTSGTTTKRISFYVNNAAPMQPTNRFSEPSFNTFTQTSLTQGVPYNQTITVSGNPAPVITSEVTRPVKAAVFFLNPYDGSAITSNQRTQITNAINQSKTFYSNQMNALGYGRQTFDTYTDSGGNLIINTFTMPSFFTRAYYQTQPNPPYAASWNARTYIAPDTTPSVLNSFDASDLKIVFPNAGNTTDFTAGWAIATFGSGPNVDQWTRRHRWSGILMPYWNFRTTGHEIGHLFGLPHVQDRSNIMYERTSSSAPGNLTQDQADRINNWGYATVPDTSINLSSYGLTLNGPTLSGTPRNIPSGGLTFDITFTAKNALKSSFGIRRIVTFTIGT